MTTIRCLILAPVGVCLMISMVTADEPVRIGSRRELMVDQHLIDKMDGVRLVLHHPTPREIVLVHDKHWEESGSLYHSVFQDGDRYRMYYYGVQMTVTRNKLVEPPPAIHLAARRIRFSSSSVQRRGVCHKADRFLRP